MLERTELSAFAAFEECKVTCGPVLVTVDATFPGVRIPESMPKLFGIYVNLAFNRPNGAKDLLWDAMGVTETLHHGGHWQSMHVPWGAVTSIRGEAGAQPLFWLKCDRGTFADSARFETQALTVLRKAPAQPRREVRTVWTKNGARQLLVHQGGGETTAARKPTLRVIEGGDPAANDDPEIAADLEAVANEAKEEAMFRAAKKAGLCRTRTTHTATAGAGAAMPADDPKSFREAVVTSTFWPILEIVLLGYAAMLGILAIGFTLGAVGRIVVWFFEGWGY
jgi:hypothetical protein